jgi:hypothetical protein
VYWLITGTVLTMYMLLHCVYWHCTHYMLKRDVLWPRHSHAWVINSPTWPVEWKQITPFLGWQDYMATGTA